MPITLSQMVTSQPDFVDVPYKPLNDSFRLHYLPIDQMLAMRSVFADFADSGDVSSSGDIEIETMAPMVVPIIAKSLGGDWDTDAGRKYLGGRFDLLATLTTELVKLHSNLLPDTDVPLETAIKNE